MQGVAHISFAGGSVFLPARTPYERQTMIDYVADRMRLQATIQVIVDKQHWTVQASDPAVAKRCSRCHHTVKVICSLAGHESSGLCMWCAFGHRLQAHRIVWRPDGEPRPRRPAIAKRRPESCLESRRRTPLVSY